MLIVKISNLFIMQVLEVLSYVLYLICIYGTW